METTALSTTQEALLQAKDIIAQNIASNEKAKEVAKILLAKIENTPISDTPEVRFLDEECKTFLGKISKTISAMTDRRKPITQAFDQIRKHFTELENELKTGEEIQAIQNFRNAFATVSMLSPTPEEYTLLITDADCSAAFPVSPK